MPQMTAARTTCNDEEKEIFLGLHGGTHQKEGQKEEN
jgi:hypothetical protein